MARSVPDTYPKYRPYRPPRRLGPRAGWAALSLLFVAATVTVLILPPTSSSRDVGRVASLLDPSRATAPTGSRFLSARIDVRSGGGREIDERAGAGGDRGGERSSRSGTPFLDPATAFAAERDGRSGTNPPAPEPPTSDDPNGGGGGGNPGTPGGEDPLPEPWPGPTSPSPTPTPTPSPSTPTPTPTPTPSPSPPPSPEPSFESSSDEGKDSIPLPDEDDDDDESSEDDLTRRFRLRELLTGR